MKLKPTRLDPIDLEVCAVRLLRSIANEFEWNWHVAIRKYARKSVLMASRESHCLADLLHRWPVVSWSAISPVVISNHDDCAVMVRVATCNSFHMFPVDPPEYSALLQSGAPIDDYSRRTAWVLARYMQILRRNCCPTVANR